MLCTSCTDNTAKNSSERTPKNKEVYSGSLNVAIDETLNQIMAQQIELFEYYYDSVKVNVQYVSDDELMRLLRNKKIDVAVFSRELTKNERDAMKSADTLYLRELTVAYDAIAVIAKRNFNDSTLDSVRLGEYLNGKVNALDLIFDNENSSVVKYIFGKYGIASKAESNIYAVKNADEVINYVSEKENSIGFISYSKISDEDEFKTKQKLKGIKVLGFNKHLGDSEIRVSANQSDIAEGVYPLTRPINTVMRLSHNDNLEWLFVNFMYRQKAARVFLKSGLIPALMPEREIKVNTEGLKSNT